ncbi:MAG: VacJ family lipoprotein [Halieaceae bacterium]|nr:VacJ family lipoprotein [Halieaceae bacterium]
MSVYRLATAASLALLFLLSGCAGAPDKQDLSAYPEPLYPVERLVPEDLYDPQAAVYDPFEPINKRIYSFNYHFDRAVFLPVTNTWRRVMPGFVRKGVSNFFNNIRDLRTLANSILQLAPDKAAQSAGRVLVNSTVGIYGFIDVATSLDFPRPNEDFGQTLGRWGVGKGPFIMIPFLGPSNMRDGLGMLPDVVLQTEAYGGFLAKPLRSTIFVFDAIDTRSRVPFRYYETGSVYEYETVRWLLSVKRDLDVAK